MQRQLIIALLLLVVAPANAGEGRVGERGPGMSPLKFDGMLMINLNDATGTSGKGSFCNWVNNDQAGSDDWSSRCGFPVGKKARIRQIQYIVTGAMTADCPTRLLIDSVVQTWTRFTVHNADTSACDELVDTGAAGVDAWQDACLIRDAVGSVVQPGQLVQQSYGTCRDLQGFQTTIWYTWE